jgi:hypothetical protein
MKYLLGFAAIVIAVVMAASLLLAPLTANQEARTEQARAARIAEETRLEQADAFGLKTMAILPWGLLILGGVFVGSLIVVLVFRPQQGTIDTLGQLPPQIGQRPVYFVQGLNESPEAFMMRVTMQMRQIDAPEMAHLDRR